MFSAQLSMFWLAIGFSALVKSEGADVKELRAYGPGGPLDPITECGRIFSNQEGIHVSVIGAPEEQWITQAQKDADVVFGGADYMLTELTLKFPDFIDKSTRTELYSRDAVILVRRGNPKKIAEFKDLAQPGIKIVDVPAQVRLVSGKISLVSPGLLTSRNRSLCLLRAALPRLAPGKADPSLDAWITFRTWQYRLPEATEIVEIDRKYRPSRATPIAIAKTSSDPALAQKFIDYLKSDAGKAIFQKWGYN